MITRHNNRREAMAGTIRARVTGGMLEPLEVLNLPEGKEVTVTILDVPSAGDVDAFRRSAGGWKGTIKAEEFKRNIYTDRMISTRSEPRLY
jgi:predicted DNA-binding antitoxin AbrB/MazE fold protein